MKKKSTPKTRTISLRVEVEVSGETTTAILKKALAKKLGNRRQHIIFTKDTLPDPDTVRTGSILWKTARIMQGRKG